MVKFKNSIANAIGSALLEFSNGKTTNYEMVEGVEITRQSIDVHDWAVEARAYTFRVYQENGVIDAIYQGDIIEALSWAYPFVMTPEFLASYAPMNADFPSEIIDHIAVIQMMQHRVEKVADVPEVVKLIGDIAENAGISRPSPALTAMIEQILSESRWIIA